MKTFSIVVASLFFFFNFNNLFAKITNDSIQATLVSEVDSIKPGQPFWVGLHLKMEPGWHIYWKNPGATGFPPSIEWQLPQGFEASDIHWPTPLKMTLEGFTSYGYENEVLLPIQITPPQELDKNQSITLLGKATWLACKESCIPGNKDFELNLPVKESEGNWNSSWHPAFEMARSHFPKHLKEWNVRAYLSKGDYGLLIEPANGKQKLPDSLEFFSYNNDIKTDTPQILKETPTGYFLILPLESTIPTHLEGILINPKGWSPSDKNKALAIDLTGHTDAPLTEMSTSHISLIKAIIFAFLGGVILNLMPCVFPILGLKVMSFMKHAGESALKAQMHGLVFTLGVLASFLCLAGLLLILRAGGEQLGWGFQLQSPFFITFLCFLLLLLALNFLGVYEMGTSLISLGNGFNHQSGYVGTFSSGILATVLATPCSAPFMGSALGFALTQPASYSLCIFAALGLGMSAPYLLLSFSPALIKKLPRPGVWMETFKQAMAFPLFATVLWLLWVFGIQTHHNSLIGLSFGLLLASMAAWIYGRFATFNTSKKKRHTAQGVSAVLLIIGIVLGYSFAKVDPAIPQPKNLAPHIGGLAWEDYSSELLQELRGQGKAIFIDFTAAWCLTCQANKKNVFSSDQVIYAIKDKDVILLHADWTKSDPEITKALQSYGRSGVPTNVIYPRKPNSSPILLPELLTPNIVLNALEKI